MLSQQQPSPSPFKYWSHRCIHTIIRYCKIMECTRGIVYFCPNSPIWCEYEWTVDIMTMCPTIIKTVLNGSMTRCWNRHLEPVQSSPNITTMRIFVSNALFIKLHFFICWRFISASLSLIRKDSKILRPNFTHLYSGVHVYPKYIAKFLEYTPLYGTT